MPRNVKTRWNSTFYLIDFGLEYRAAVDRLTNETTKKAGPSSTQRRSKNPLKNLKNLRISGREWRLLEQLRDVLKVRCHVVIFLRSRLELTTSLDTRRGNDTLFARHT